MKADGQEALGSLQIKTWPALKLATFAKIFLEGAWSPPREGQKVRDLGGNGWRRPLLLLVDTVRMVFCLERSAGKP